VNLINNLINIPFSQDC